MSRKNAVVLALLGAVFMSFAALLVVLIETADGFQILTFRSGSQFLIILAAACYLRKISPFRFLRNLDRIDCLIGFFMSFAFIFYIFALLHTSVASALFILSVAPVIAALLNWALFGERPRPVVWICILAAIIGVSIMVSDATELGNFNGNAFAFMSAAFFASMLVTARNSGKSDVLSGNFLGALFAFLGTGLAASFLSETGLKISSFDLMLALLCGAFTIGIGIICVALAAPHLPPAEISILILLESVLSPIWVWMILSQPITSREIIGGSVVLAAVVLLSLNSKGSQEKILTVT